MIRTENEKLQFLLLAAPLAAEITMLAGFFLALVLLLFHFGIL
tara:strand:- start:666 stop:794 length:129 start_codon:yes stop_codon:yes gene_type:complete